MELLTFELLTFGPRIRSSVASLFFRWLQSPDSYLIHLRRLVRRLAAEHVLAGRDVGKVRAAGLFGRAAMSDHLSSPKQLPIAGPKVADEQIKLVRTVEDNW